MDQPGSDIAPMPITGVITDPIDINVMVDGIVELINDKLISSKLLPVPANDPATLKSLRLVRLGVIIKLTSLVADCIETLPGAP